MVYKNLIEGQYQIGDIVMGHGTNIIVENFDVKPYDVNAQDYQVTRSDEVRFGYDTFKPTTIEISATVIYNWLLSPFQSTRTNFWHNMVTVNDLAKEWRANDIRNVWGEMKPLFYCGRDGIGKVIFGRPGQFGVEKSAANATFTKCVAEFRRADTLVYSATEYVTNMTTTSSLTRTVGNSETWARVIINGPATNPSVQIGNSIIQLQTTLASGKFIEINSYPWTRRVINSDGVNLSSTVTGASAYLDQLKFNLGTTPVKIISGATSGYYCWRDAWSTIE